MSYRSNLFRFENTPYLDGFSEGFSHALSELTNHPAFDAASLEQRRFIYELAFRLHGFVVRREEAWLVLSPPLTPDRTFDAGLRAGEAEAFARFAESGLFVEGEGPGYIAVLGD